MWATLRLLGPCISRDQTTFNSGVCYALMRCRYNIVVMWIACVGGLIALLVVAGALLMANRSVVAPGRALWRSVRGPGDYPMLFVSPALLRLLSASCWVHGLLLLARNVRRLLWRPLWDTVKGKSYVIGNVLLHASLLCARCAGFPPSPTAAAAARAPPSPKPGPPVFVVTQPGGGLDLAVRVTPDPEPPAPGSLAAACPKAQPGAGGAPFHQTGRMHIGGPGVRA